MANLPRTRKRVHAIRRAPDGSAFQKCYFCKAMVPIALLDMHECDDKGKHKIKRFKGVSEKPKPVKQGASEKPKPVKQGASEKPKPVKQGAYGDQARSPFLFFMERFAETCSSGEWLDIDRKGFDTWKSMSKEERQPYVIQAEMLDADHRRALLKEATDMPKFADDEADSAMVGKYDRSYAECSENSGSESLNTYDLEMGP